MDKLIFVLENLDDVPEALQGFYSQDKASGKFVLNVDGAVPKAKVDEFRENNIKFKRERDEAQKELAKYKDIDLDQYGKDQEELDALRAGNASSPEKFEAELTRRTENMKLDFEKRFKAQQTAIDERDSKLKTVETQLSDLIIVNGIKEAALKAKVKPGALDDVVLRAKGTWQLKDGKAVPIGEDGTTIYGKTGSDAMTMDEWVTDLSSRAEHLFEGSTGGGGQGADKGGKSGRVSQIDRNDSRAVGNSLQDIASGKAVLV